VFVICLGHLSLAICEKYHQRHVMINVQDSRSKTNVVRIRLRRMGAKKKPFYRIVVADQQAARNGGFIENIGTYDPMTDPETVFLQTDRAAHWLTVGAQPSDAVARLLRKENLLKAGGQPVVSAAPIEEAA
jgi:small subunit ribosomal protein S16